MSRAPTKLKVGWPRRLGHLRWIQHDFPHDIDPHEHPGTHSAVSSRPGQEAAAGTDNGTQTNTNVREHACGRRSHPPWMPTAASNEKATSLHSNFLHRHAAEVPDGVPRARIGLALVLRWERRSGRRDGQNGGHVDGGDGGGHEWGSACEPRAQTCVSIYVRVDGSMSRDVKRMGGRRRAHLCARRRSCRGRWLPTGRSGPRAPGGVGRGSRRPLWPPRLPASAIAAQPNRRASRNAEKMKPRTRMMTPTMPGAITATRTISSRMYARERRSTQHMSEQSRRRRLWRSKARLRRTPGGSAARSCGPGAPGLPRWTTLSPPRASKSSSAGQGGAPGQRMSRPMRPEVTSDRDARAHARPGLSSR